MIAADRGPITAAVPGWWRLEAIQSLVSALDPTPGPARRARAQRALEVLREHEETVEPRAAAAVLVDLHLHGWRFGEQDGSLEFTPPSVQVDAVGEKRRVQAQLAMERADQLEDPAVRQFIRRMETPRRLRGELFSVLSLLRDGRDLAARLRGAEGDPQRLGGTIAPYLQVIEGEERCERTGLVLRDVWRYFRHTWATPYKPVPGRGMAILVRDGAVEPHPVIGIALIGSPPPQISDRDAWIGWSPEATLRACREAPSGELAAWLLRAIREELDEIHTDELLQDGILEPGELTRPREATAGRLLGEARRRRAEHERFSGPAELKRRAEAAAGDDAAWRALARVPLYRAKRCELLAAVLTARARLGVLAADPGALPGLARTGAGADAIRAVSRRSKARRMGVAIAEIAVCGAISPYRELLGGKLVSLLLMSPEVRHAYARRYDEAESVIASWAAGRCIRRAPELALLMTTSLYGSSASQYNRLRLPRAAAGGSGPDLGYLPIGRTQGFGSSQFSAATIEALALFLSQAGNGRRINSVFGEGVSPRLRKAREGLELLGLPAHELLVHGSSRLVYAIPLADNVQRHLQGLDEDLSWSLPGDRPEATTAAIADWWKVRWLRPRAAREPVLLAVARHTLDRPVRHGGRVNLVEDEGVLSPFT